MLDVLIHHIVHMTHYDYTLPILQNFTQCDSPCVRCIGVCMRLTVFVHVVRFFLFVIYYIRTWNASQIAHCNHTEWV